MTVSMKKGFLFCSLAFWSITINAQTRIGIEAKAEKGFGPISKGEFVINSVDYKIVDPNSVAMQSNGYIINMNQKGKEYTFNTISMPNTMALSPINSNMEDYWILRNICSLGVLSKIKDLYSVRTSLEDDTYEYIQFLENSGLVFDDPYLKSYLYSIVSKIIPKRRADGFPYDIRVMIVQDDSINASMCPNGTLVVNTGLLAAIHTEDELVAILSHEIGHYMANHSLCNIYKAEKRKAAAEFWAAVATIAAAAGEAVAAKNGYYTYGNVTTATAILSTSIALEVVDRMGKNYSKEQEKDADMMANEALALLGYDTNALASVFRRMADVYDTEGNWAAYYLSGDHPSLKERIEYCGVPYTKRDKEFEKKVSFAVTSAAITKFNMGRFTQAMKFVDQNIENNVATDDDLLIKALCLVNLFDENNTNKEALNLIQKAKEYNPSNTNIRRTEIIVSSRMGNISSTKVLLDDYLKDISMKMQELDKDSFRYSYYEREYDWAKRMSIKFRYY